MTIDSPSTAALHNSNIGIAAGGSDESGGRSEVRSEV